MARPGGRREPPQSRAVALASVTSAHTESVVPDGLNRGLVGRERIELARHWASDVEADALIGSAVGPRVVHHHDPCQHSRLDWRGEPVVGPRTVPFQVALSR